MSEPEHADIIPINYDFTYLTSKGLALFDIRNWYACSVRLITVGERFFTQCRNMWNTFLNSTLLVAENTENAGCAVCGQRPPQTEEIRPSKAPSESFSQNALPSPTAQLGNISGRWVFVPNLAEITSLQNAVAGTTVRNAPVVEENEASASSSDESTQPSVSLAVPTPSTKKSAKSKQRSVLTTKKATTTTRKTTVRAKETPKSARNEELPIPLVSQRPKRQTKKT